MFQPQSPFLRDFIARGYLHQCTDMEGLDQLCMPGKPPLVAYIGFDATADSLHVGSMVQIMMLRLLQKSGGKPVVLMGGGTTKVGDPTGRDDMRKILSDADIARNIAGIKKVFARFLKFGDGPTDAIMVNNADWLDKLNYLEFLRDYGRHFSVNRMLGFDSVKLRLDREQPLTFLEFNYMILQAYDFLELNRRYKCVAQLGGSDQWGNIVNGVELGRRCDDKALFGLTSPLITLSSGAKMGKSAQGAVWLNEERLSAYDYWQFWRNTEDADVGRFLRLFTELPLTEIERLESLEGAEINEAKIVLADEATKLCRGLEAAADAKETARKVFVEGGLGGDLPEITVFRHLLDTPDAQYIKILVESGLQTSKSEARKLIRNAGLRKNDQVIPDENASISASDFVTMDTLKLSIGKKRHIKVRVVDAK